MRPLGVVYGAVEMKEFEELKNAMLALARAKKVRDAAIRALQQAESQFNSAHLRCQTAQHELTESARLAADLGDDFLIPFSRDNWGDRTKDPPRWVSDEE